MKVSVIVPTYNRGNTVGKAIQSVIDQTFRNWELIVVDDASRDHTRVVVTSYEDTRIRYIRHDVNQGGAAARNTGIRASKGEYVAFLDSDDEWLSQKLERQLEAIENAPSSTSVVYCRHFLEDPLDCCTREPDDFKMYSGDVRENLLSGWCPATTSAFLVERSSLEKTSLFDEQLPSFQDYDLWIQLSKVSSFEYVNQPLLIKYEGKGGQITGNFRKRIEGAKMILNKWRKEIEKSEHSNLLELKKRIVSGIHRNALHYENSNFYEHLRSLAEMKSISIKDITKALLVGLLGKRAWCVAKCAYKRVNPR